jgi:uncharacterized membrane protein
MLRIGVCCLVLFACTTAAALGQVAEYAVPAELPGNVQSNEYATATVEAVVRDERDTVGGFDHRTQTVSMRITSGPRTGERFVMENGILDNRNDMTLHPGEQVVVERLVRYDGSVRYMLRERYRLPALLWLFVGFLLLSVVFGGIRGVTSVFGLVASVAILGLYVVPAIAKGSDPLVTSIVGSYCIAVTSMYLAHGLNKRTTVALLSTCITLALAALAAFAATQFARLFGMGTEESMYLQTGSFGAVHLQGLLIGGFIIGTLGVLDDVTTAQTAAVDEISKANPSLGFAALQKAGMSVGKEHIASLINTLALAYVGASLPLFLLFRENDTLPSWIVLNSEFIAEEVVRTLVGSTALLLAVPISTFFAAYFLRNRTGTVLQSTHPPHPCLHHHA